MMMINDNSFITDTKFLSHDTIRYDKTILKCAQKPTGNMLNAKHAKPVAEKNKETEKNVKQKNPFQIQCVKGSPVDSLPRVWRKGFVEKIGFESGVKSEGMTT